MSSSYLAFHKAPSFVTRNKILFSNQQLPTGWSAFTGFIDKLKSYIEDESETQRWLTSPQAALEGQTPLKALVTDAGAKKVEEILYRAEYGIFG